MERIPVEVIRVWVLVQSCILWLGTMEGPRRDPEPSARGGFWENPRCESPQSSGGLRSGICWEYHWFLLPFPLANYSNVHCCFHDPTHQPFAHCSIDGPVSYLKKKQKNNNPGLSCPTSCPQFVHVALSVPAWNFLCPGKSLMSPSAV